MLIEMPRRTEIFGSVKIHELQRVLRAIPFDCSVIVVSNSGRETPDTYKMEQDVVKNLHDLTQQEMFIIHQKDPELGFAFYDAG